MSAYTQFVKAQFAVLDQSMSAKDRMSQIAALWREQKGDTSGAKPRAKKEKAVAVAVKAEPVIAVKQEPVIAVKQEPAEEVKQKKKRGSRSAKKADVFFLPPVAISVK